MSVAVAVLDPDERNAIREGPIVRARENLSNSLRVAKHIAIRVCRGGNLELKLLEDPGRRIEAAAQRAFIDILGEPPGPHRCAAAPELAEVDVVRVVPVVAEGAEVYGAAMVDPREF